MSSGFLMKSCSAGIITVEAKSGRVSRSRNCEICLAPEISSSAFFWMRVVVAGVRLFVGGDVVRVALEVGVLRLRPRQGTPAAPSPAASFFGSLDSMKPSIGASTASCAVLGVDLREREEVEILECLALELLADEGAEHVHRRVLVERLRRVLPRAAERALGVVRQQLAPGLEHGLDLGAVPRGLAGHQLHVEVVAVDAHVDVVERAHRGPAVLVAEGDRRHAVLLDLLAERLEVVQVRGRLVAVLLPDALPVEDRPRVVVERHEVLLAVEPGGGLLEGVGEAAADLLPDVVDVASPGRARAKNCMR